MFLKIVTAIWLSLIIGVATANPEQIQLVVPVTPGGATDMLARSFIEPFAKHGITVIVINKPGGEKSIGANYVATAAADGRTFYLGAISDTVLLPLIKFPGLQYDEKSFVPVAGIARLPIALAVSNNVPVSNIKEFLALVSKDPGKYGVGTTGKVAELIASTVYGFANVAPTNIPYKGDLQIATDLAGGHLQVGLFSFSTPVIELHKAGKLKIIAVLSKDRSKSLPSVGTISELNGYNDSYWFGIFAPPGTHPVIADKMNTMFNTALHDPIVKRLLEDQQFTEMVMTRSQFEKFYRGQFNTYRPQVEKNLLKLN